MSRPNRDTRCRPPISGSPRGRRARWSWPRRLAVRDVLAHVLLGLGDLLRDALADHLLEHRVAQALDDLLEVALDEDAHGITAGDAAAHHVEDLVLVDLADRAAVRGLDVVGLDDQ